MQKVSSILALALICVPSMAQAAQASACLTAGEFTSLASYALPSVIKGARQRCSSSLARDAFLPLNGAQLETRYAELKTSNWPAAKAAFVKMSGNGGAEASNMIKMMPDSTLQLMLDGVIEGMIGQQLPTERCGAVDRLVNLLSPLPARNTAELIALAAGLGARSGKAKAGGFSLCQA